MRALTIMIFLSLPTFAAMADGGDPKGFPAMPVRVRNAWTVVLGPGAVTLNGTVVRLETAVEVPIAPPETVAVRDEAHDSLPVYDSATPWGWLRGTRFRRLVAEECSATGLLDAGSVRVKTAPGQAKALIRGTDFEFDPLWMTLGRVEGGAIAPGQKVYIDYDYTPQRLDSIVYSDGQARVVRGVAAAVGVHPPDVPEGAIVLANVFLSGPMTTLTGENLYPIDPDVAPETKASPSETKSSPRETPSQAERFFPRSLAKLRAGKPVTIVAWGDSVTSGGGVVDRPECYYQNLFVGELRTRFPKSDIRLLTAAWPGASSAMYLAAPAGGHYDFVRDVLDPKPDLVTIEFVNDASLNEEETVTHYEGILKRIQGVGAEVVLLTPHLVRPDWLQVDTLKFDDDPRPFVAGLRRVARERNLAVADAATLWCRLYRRGIPYTTLLANSINHPDARGHQLFVEALMALFPEK